VSVPEERKESEDTEAVRYQTGKNPKRQIVGLHNRDAGEQFENIIKAACDFYRDNGIAEIDKTPEPMRALYPMENGKFVACFTKRAQPDFKGCLDGGRCVCFEAKHTEQDRIKSEAVTEEQENVLDRYSARSAECFVVVSFGFFSFYRIPWGVWKNMKRIYGRKYLTPQDATQYKIKFKCGILDFLGKAELRQEVEKTRGINANKGAT